MQPHTANSRPHDPGAMPSVRTRYTGKIHKNWPKQNNVSSATREKARKRRSLKIAR